MRAAIITLTLLLAGGCGDDRVGDAATTSPSSTDVPCKAGSSDTRIDPTPVSVVVIAAPISKGTTVREAIASGALRADEVCRGYAPQGAVETLGSLDPNSTAITDLEPNQIVVSQHFG